MCSHQALACILTPPIRALTLSGNYNQAKCTYIGTAKERTGRDIRSNSSVDEERDEAKGSCELERYKPRLYRQPAV